MDFITFIVILLHQSLINNSHFSFALGGLHLYSYSKDPDLCLR